MIAFFAMFIFVLTFIAGYLFASYPVSAVVLLGMLAISAGCLTAFLQSSRLPEYDEYEDQ